MGFDDKPKTGGDDATNDLRETAQQGDLAGQAETAADFDEKKKEMVDRVEEIFKKHVSAANPALQERGFPELERMKAGWIADIEKLFNERKQKYEEMSVTAGMNMPAERRNLMNEILAGATRDAETKLKLIEGAIEKTKTGEQVGSADAGNVERAVKGVEKLMNANPDLQETGLKLTEGKNRADDLTERDYFNVITLLRPYDISRQSTDAKSTFEATSAGTLIGLMSPEQRYRLMQVLMTSQKKDETVSIMDGLLSVGLLSRDQGESLMKEAIAKGLLTQQRFDGDFKAKFEQGYYDAEVQKYRAIINAEDRQKYAGVYSENIMNRVVGRPLVGGLLALWGLILVTLNVAANWKDKQAMLKNPYIYAGAAGVLAGTEIATGTLNRKTSWFGAGVVSRGLYKLGGAGDEKKNYFEMETRGKIANVLLNAPAPLVAYLDGGGYATMLELRAEKSQKGEKPLVTVDELIQKEKTKGADAQAGRLAQLKTMSFVSVADVNMKLNMVSEGASNVLNIENNEAFAAMAQEIRATQKPGGAPAEVPATAPTAVAQAPVQAPAQPAKAASPAPSQPPKPSSDKGPIIA
jgi:hypothetical protein